MEHTQVGKDLIEIGRIRGIDQGRQEGRQEGVSAVRWVIFQVLMRRFKRVPVSLNALVHRISDLDLASVLLLQTIEAESLESIEETLRASLES